MEVPPKFEFFDDRIKITSFGGLPQGMTESEFFEGYSVPHILRSYGRECFKFTDNFLRMTFPAAEQVIKLITVLDKEMDRHEMQEQLHLADLESFRAYYLKPAFEAGLVEMTIPDKPNSQLQKYRLSTKGKVLEDSLK